MSLLELFFPIATVVLAVGCYTCYRTGKPARELLAEKRQAEAEKKEREERDGRERNRQNLFNKEFLEMFDAVLRDPQRYLTPSLHSHRSGWKYPAIKDLIDQTRHWEQLGRTNRSQENQINDLIKSHRELRAEVKEVHRAMALNTGDY